MSIRPLETKDANNSAFFTTIELVWVTGFRDAEMNRLRMAKSFGN